MDDLERNPAVHAFSPEAIGRVRTALETAWDPGGDLRRAAAARDSRDAASPRSLADHARVLCGILAAGGTKADVVAYLRDEELALHGEVRSSPRTLAAIGREAWLAARGLPPE